MYIQSCLFFNFLAGYKFLEHYGFSFVGSIGPSMLPTIGAKDDLVFLDKFTTTFIRKPRKGEII